MKINVLHIVDSLRAGGAEMIAINTFNALNKGTVIKAYICATRMEGELKDNIEELSNYLFLDKKRTFDIKALKKLFVFIRNKQISILHAHTTSFFTAILVKLRYPKIKIFWHNHTGANINLKGWKKVFLKCSSIFFDTVINVNEDLNIWVKETLLSKKSYTLNNFALQNKSNSTIKLKGNKLKKIVCVAGLRPEKDHLNLLEAFLLLRKTYPEVSLHLIGRDYKNDYSRSIKKYILQNNLNDDVFLYDNCSDIYNVLKQASIGVLASKSEGLPISLLEYGLAKLPVVVTDVGDCSKLVLNGFNGIIAKKENSNELMKSLLFLLENEQKSISFGIQLEKTVSRDYSLENNIKKLTKIYSSN